MLPDRGVPSLPSESIPFLKIDLTKIRLDNCIGSLSGHRRSVPVAYIPLSAVHKVCIDVLGWHLNEMKLDPCPAQLCDQQSNCPIRPWSMSPRDGLEHLFVAYLFLRDLAP